MMLDPMRGTIVVIVVHFSTRRSAWTSSFSAFAVKWTHRSRPDSVMTVAMVAAAAASTVPKAVKTVAPAIETTQFHRIDAFTKIFIIRILPLRRSFIESWLMHACVRVRESWLCSNNFLTAAGCLPLFLPFLPLFWVSSDTQCAVRGCAFAYFFGVFLSPLN